MTQIIGYFRYVRTDPECDAVAVGRRFFKYLARMYKVIHIYSIEIDYSKIGASVERMVTNTCNALSDSYIRNRGAFVERSFTDRLDAVGYINNCKHRAIHKRLMSNAFDAVADRNAH